jgi:Tfp pilus assembly PilM family ATPase/Tfp pilus assembly protein PilN
MTTVLSLEIAKNWLKLAVGKPKRKSFQLLNCVLKDTASLAEDEISLLITRILKEWKIKVKSVVVSIPRNLITLRNLHLPSQVKEEISQMIELHIGRIVPYPREEIVCGYFFGGIDDIGYARVILGILHRDIVNRQIKILEKANLFIDTFVLSSYNVWRGVVSIKSPLIHPGEIYVALDVDYSFTDFIIFSKEELLFSRSINLEATKLFNQQEAVTKLIGEVRQSLVIFQNEEVNKRPIKIFLSGAGPNIKGLDAALRKELEIDVEVMSQDYLKNIRGVQVESYRSFSFTSIVDLMWDRSEKRLCFVIPELEIRKQLREKTKEFILLGSLFVYLLSLLGGIFATRIYYHRKYLDNLRQEFEMIKSEVQDLEEKWSKVKFVKEQLRERRVPFFLVYKLEEVLPQEIIINFIRLDDKNKVTVKGLALQLSDVFNFVGILEDVAYFHDVETKSTTKRSVEGREVTEFEIVFRISE